jgi:hypothetical protein
MNLIFDKSLGGIVLVAIFGKQSKLCSFCSRKVTKRNLGMVFKYNDSTYVCCNSFICLLDANRIGGKDDGHFSRLKREDKK